MTSEQFCTFFLDAHLFGARVANVQEVAQHLEMTRIPLAPKVVRGLINLRGQIVPAIDLRRRLNLPDFAADRLPMNVVVRGNEGPVSLLVDEISDVVEVDDEKLESPPATLDGFAREVVHGVYQLPGRLLLVLDIERVVDLTDLRTESPTPRRHGTLETAQSISAKTRKDSRLRNTE